MWQRKQTIFLAAAVILTVVCLSMQIGSFKAAGLAVGKVYNLWFTDPLGHHHFDTWPLMAILLPTAALGTYTIFIYHNRKVQALFCALNALLIVGWYVFRLLRLRKLGTDRRASVKELLRNEAAKPFPANNGTL